MNQQPQTIKEALASFRKAAKRMHLSSLNLAKAVERELIAERSSGSISLAVDGERIAAASAAVQERSEKLLSQAESALSDSKTNDVRPRACGPDGRAQPAPVSITQTAPAAAPTSRETATSRDAGRAAPPSQPSIPASPGATAARPATPFRRQAKDAPHVSARPPLSNPQRSLYDALLRVSAGERAFKVHKQQLMEETGNQGNYVLMLLSTLRAAGYIAWDWIDGERHVTLIDPSDEDMAKARRTDAAIAQGGYLAGRDGPVRLLPVVAWLREHGDYISWDSKAGRYNVGTNYARATPQELLKRANLMRWRMKLPSFPDSLADGEPAGARGAA